MIYKGQDSFLESYSTFFDNRMQNETKLRRDLEEHQVTDVFVCGLAFDYCVGK